MTDRRRSRLVLVSHSIRVAAAAAIALAMSLTAAAQSDEAEETQAVKEAAARAEELAAQSEEEVQGDAKVKALKKMARQLEEQQRAFHEAQKEFDDERRARHVERAEYERARMIAEQSRKQSHLSEAQMQQMQAQLKKARGQLAEMAARIQQRKAEPLPDDAELHAFKLRYVRAPDVANALRNLFGNSAGPRVAIDERTNMLIVAGNEKQTSVVEHVVKSLDEPGADAKNSQPGDTLQLRIVWLLDGVEGREPAGLISPQVLEALQQLGFEAPAVVCQQVTTLTLGEENPRGQFQFSVPVLVNSQPWQLGGSGLVTPAGNDRFALQFEMEVEQQNNPQKGRLGGSIYSPLGHYTVMGTTTFVASDSQDPRVEGAGPPQQRQHLSAFVVYLDRAPEFPAGKAK